MVHPSPALATVLTALALSPACAEAPPPRPNVVLVVVDTLRADRLSFLGCPRETTPFLDQLAEESLVFENAWSPSSWTLPATVSVFTSLHPEQHGVTDLVGLELEPGDEPVPVNCIPSEVETLAETLQAAGYRTYGVVSNILVGSEVGMDRGFDRFQKLEDEDADAVNALATAWRDEIQGNEPFFLYLHYIDPHDVFHAREPWFELPASAAEAGWPDEFSKGSIDHGDLEWFMTRLDPLPEGFEGKEARDLTPAEFEELMTWARAAYDSEIGFVDSRIREVYESFGMEEAVFVFLADHGEEFWEHGDLTHGQNLHVETVRVPLLLRSPRGDGPKGRVATHVSTLDVLPTLRTLLDLASSDQDRGRDLLADADLRRGVLGSLPGKSGQHAHDEDLRSIVSGGHRLIVLEGGSVELYDLESDPLERVNLAESRPEVVEQLLRELEEAEAAAPRYPHARKLPPPPSEAMLEHLRGIGYTGDD